MKLINILLAGLSVSVSSLCSAQNPSSSITTWKNDAKGTYNIIHDDFGDWTTTGIENYADTICSNRGIKFTMGAITRTSAERAIYGKATSMIKDHGHEIINHSHNHTCAVSNQCGGSGGWADPGTEMFNIEIDQSTKAIFDGTGYQPRYYIFPFDAFNDTANAYLKTKGYIGSRSGGYNQLAENTFTPDNDGFFTASFVVDAAGGVVENLNEWVDSAIIYKAWVNRELHNVGNSGWGSVTVTNYRNHLNYVKSKVASGDLWVGTVSEILTYQIQKLNYTPSTSYNSTAKEIDITWNTPSFDVAAYLAPLQIKSPVTIKVDLDGITGAPFITQGNATITDHYKKDGKLYIQAYPHLGPIKIRLSDCQSVCITTDPVSQTVNNGTNVVFTVAAVSENTMTYVWKLDNVAIPNATTSSYTINAAQLTHAGIYTVEVSSNGTTVVSKQATLTVNHTSTPFNAAPLAIPGKIEFEQFDKGGQDNAYNDLTNTNQGNAKTYRPNDFVDIETCSDAGGGYDIGYAQTGEWLMYTVDISSDQKFDFDIRYATATTGPKPSISFYVDGKSVMAPTTFNSTGGWQTWQTKTVSGINLPEGKHWLMLKFDQGDVNLNYVTVKVNPTAGISKEGNAISKFVYPNPSTSEFTAEFPVDGTLKLYDTKGVLVEQLQVGIGETIHFGSSLKSGVYVIKFSDETSVYTGKLIKE